MLTISIKEASELSGMSKSFIRSQVERGKIPEAYFIKHKKRKTYVIFRIPFENWLKTYIGDQNE